MLYNYADAKKDCLCCGSAARLCAASALGIELNKTYDSLLTRTLGGKLRLFSPLETDFVNPGLMQGLAGIGYTLAMHGEKNCGGMLF